MIDAPAVMIVVGSAIQAAPAAQRVALALRPRAAAFVASLRSAPLPPVDPALDELVASID